MSDNSSSREARRRRIVQRGTDRLALITGQIRSLPTDADADSRSTDQQPQLPSKPSSSPPSQSPSFDSPGTEDILSDSLQRNLETISETSQQFMSGDRVGPILRKCGGSMEEAPRVSSFDLDITKPSLEVPSTAQDSRIYASENNHHFEPTSCLHKFLAPKAVKSAISATQSTRTLCCIVVAILVVLASVEFPVLGSSVGRSLIFFRPLYLLLLTNITFVVAQLLEKQRGLERPEQQATINLSAGDNGLADQLGNALELGFLLQDITGALFMDCSIYAITVICGLSLAHRLGW